MSGVFAVARNIFEHEAFADEPFTEREAWIWIIREAAWKNRSARVGKARVDLKRGQCAASVRFMADVWKWHRAKVERFLNRLKTETMIETDARQGVNVITVCNYNEYQRVALPERDTAETGSETSPRQQRDSSETNKNTGENISNTGKDIPSGPAAVSAKSLEAQVFEFGKGVLGKSAGGVIVNLRKACEYDDAYVLDLLRQAAEKHDPMAWVSAAIKSVRDRPYRGVVGVETPEGPNIESKADRDYRTWEDRYYATVI